MIYIAYKYIEYMADDIILAWIPYTILVIAQLICIYKSIKTLILKDINHSRIELIFKAWFIDKNPNNMTPKYIANIESMAIINILHFFMNDYKWNIYFGKSLVDLDEGINIKKYVEIFKEFNYLIVVNNKYRHDILVFLNENANTRDKILAYSIDNLKLRMIKEQKMN